MPLTTFTNAASTSVTNNTQTKQLTSQETTTDDAKKTAGDYEDFYNHLIQQHLYHNLHNFQMLNNKSK